MLHYNNPKESDDMATYRVKASSANPTKTVVTARSFQIIVDEPKSIGGTDEGATPVEYVLGALARCLSVVGHLVAKEMNMPLEEIDFELEGDLNPARFSGKATDERAGFQEIRVKISPKTTADEATVAKWLETVEDRCPVSDNLANPTPVKITLT